LHYWLIYVGCSKLYILFEQLVSSTAHVYLKRALNRSSELWTLEEGEGELEYCMQSNIKESRHAGGGETYGEHWRVMESFRAIKGHGEQLRESSENYRYNGEKSST
jgi:hypothetical protein